MSTNSSYVKIERGIRFIYLNDSDSYRKGFKHGKLLKNEIDDLINGIFGYIDKLYGKILRKLIFNILFFISFFIKRKFPKNLIEEMKGIADGSGWKFRYVLLANTIYESAIFLHSLKFPGLHACSGFIIQGPNGGVIAGKTTDFYVSKELVDILARARTVFVYNNPNSKKYLTLSFPLCLVGDVIISDSGDFFAANDGGYTYKFNLKGLPALLFLRTLISGKNLTLSELFKKEKLIRPYAILATNGSIKGSFLYELGCSEYSVLKLKRPLLNTNFFHSKILIKKYYVRNWEKASGVKARHDTLQKNINRVKTPEDAIKMLQIHDAKYSEETGSIANFCTVQGVVFSSENNRIYLPLGSKTPVTLGKWQEYKLVDIFN